MTLAPGLRVVLSHPCHRNQPGLLGRCDRGKWWVHLDQPYRHPQTRLPSISVRGSQKYIQLEESA